MERSIPIFYCKQGLPTAKGIDDFSKDKRLIIIDDLLHEVIKKKDMELLFTQGCQNTGKCMSKRKDL
jgi:hypothetical protein